MCVQKELIHEVEMGPFKHPVDDGLDLRKVIQKSKTYVARYECCPFDSLLQVAFECMYTLMETCLDRLDVFEFLSHVEDGLKDHYDIKVLNHMIHAMMSHYLTQMLTYLLLMRLSKLRANALLQR